MTESDLQWKMIVEELGGEIGTLRIQLAAANARIKQLEQERVTDDGSTAKHDQRNSAKGSSRTADDDTNAGKASTVR